jgi:hypothetical protein
MSDVVPGIGGEIPEPEPPEQRDEIIEAEENRRMVEAEDHRARSYWAKQFYSGVRDSPEQPVVPT